MPRAPEDEGPAGPMPEAAEQEDGGLVQALPGGAAPPAPQGDVQVVPEPKGEGHVPPPPELGDGSGDVGIVEVLRALEAEQRPQAQGHVAVAGEIEVDLQGIGRGAQPGHAPVQPGPQAEGGVGDRGGHLGDQRLLGEAHDEAAEAPRALLRAGPGAVQSGGELPEAGNGAGDHLGEEGDVQQKVAEAPGGPVPVPVDVDDVSHGLEGEEGDAHRREEARRRDLRPQQGAQAPGEEVQVFERPQQEQVEGQRRRQQAALPPGPGHEKTGSEAYGGGQEETGEPLPLPAGIKQQADGDEEIDPSPAPGRPDEQPCRREEEEQEGGGMKRHANTNSI